MAAVRSAVGSVFGTVASTIGGAASTIGGAVNPYNWWGRTTGTTDKAADITVNDPTKPTTDNAGASTAVPTTTGPSPANAKGTVGNAWTGTANTQVSTNSPPTATHSIQPVETLPTGTGLTGTQDTQATRRGKSVTMTPGWLWGQSVAPMIKKGRLWGAELDRTYDWGASEAAVSRLADSYQHWRSGKSSAMGLARVANETIGHNRKIASEFYRQTIFSNGVPRSLETLPSDNDTLNGRLLQAARGTTNQSILDWAAKEQFELDHRRTEEILARTKRMEETLATLLTELSRWDPPGKATTAATTSICRGGRRRRPQMTRLSLIDQRSGSLPLTKSTSPPTEGTFPTDGDGSIGTQPTEGSATVSP